MATDKANRRTAPVEPVVGRSAGSSAETETAPQEPLRLGVIRLSSVLVGIEALALIAFAAVQFSSIDGSRTSVHVTNGVFFALFGLGIGWSAYGLWRVRRWSRGPIVLAQIIALGLAWSTIHGQSIAWVRGAFGVIALFAIIVLIVIFQRTTTRALYGERELDRYRDQQ